MFKLLPEEEKEKVQREYALRRIVVAVEAFILILIVGLVGLFPSYILSRARLGEVEERLKVSGTAEPQVETKELEAWLTDLNFKLTALVPDQKEFLPSLYMETVLKEKGSGIRITGFSWINEKEKVYMNISGVASTRQALLSLETRLKNAKSFSEVTLPVSNLAKERDVTFDLKLVPKNSL